MEISSKKNCVKQFSYCCRCRCLLFVTHTVEPSFQVTFAGLTSTWTTELTQWLQLQRTWHNSVDERQVKLKTQPWCNGTHPSSLDRIKHSFSNLHLCSPLRFIMMAWSLMYLSSTAASQICPFKTLWRLHNISLMPSCLLLLWTVAWMDPLSWPMVHPSHGLRCSAKCCQ